MTTLGSLKNGDLFRWASPLSDEDPEAIYVVMEVGKYNTQLSQVQPKVNMVFVPINTMSNGEEVIFVASVPLPA